MLDVLDAAQAAGQRSQQDAQMGQGSIFDLFDAQPDATPFAAPSYPPVPTHEFERTELLAREKESIGIFISEHPLKRVREALKVKTDCSTAQVMDQRDGEWVKVGGMITESKKIRTRTGSTMMFATLDDLDGSVEIVVFEKALAAAEGVIADGRDRARARPRRPQGGRQGLHHRQRRRQVRSVGRGDREGQGAGREARRRRDAAGARAPRSTGKLPATVLDDLRELIERYPGDTEIVLSIHTRTGLRRLKLGEAYKVQARDAGLRAELDALLPVAASAAVG